MAYVYVTIVTEENAERWGDARDLKWHLLTPRFGTQCNAAVLVTEENSGKYACGFVVVVV